MSESYVPGLTMEPWLAQHLLCDPGWPQTHRDLSASVSGVLGSEVTSTMSGQDGFSFLNQTMALFPSFLE